MSTGEITTQASSLDHAQGPFRRRAAVCRDSFAGHRAGGAAVRGGGYVRAQLRPHGHQPCELRRRDNADLPISLAKEDASLLHSSRP